MNLIEELIIDGRIYKVYEQNSTGPWFVATRPTGLFWYTVNVDTKKVKRIGPSSMKGSNSYDKATKEVELRNNKEVLLYHCNCGCGTKIVKLHGDLFIESLVVSREIITECGGGFVNNKWSLKEKGLEIIKRELDKRRIK